MSKDKLGKKGFVKNVRGVTPDFQINKPERNAMLNPHAVTSRVDRIPGGGPSAVDYPRHFPANTPDMYNPGKSERGELSTIAKRNARIP